MGVRAPKPVTTTLLSSIYQLWVKTQCALGRIVLVIEADASSAEGEIYSRMEYFVG
jgi:nitrate reductase NapAB chaperone NapD